MLLLLSLIACTKDSGDTADTGCEAPLTLFTDADGDGFGDDATQVEACEAAADQVEQGGDCDDGDGAVNPDATEFCDGIDNDCDGAPETGAAWEAADGTWTDWSDTLAAGTEASPAAITLSEAGTLHVCPGTHYVNLSSGVSTGVVGHGASASDVVLNGGGVGRVLDLEGSGLTHSVQGVQLTNGTNPAEFDDEKPSAGGISCNADDLDTTLVLDRVELTQNQGYLGGNLALMGCDTTVDDSTLSGGEAEIGGGVALLAGDLTLNNSSITGNSGAEGGGGILALPYTSEAPVVTLNDSLVADNTTEEVGGGAMLLSAELVCTSSDGGEHGILRNSAGTGSAIFGAAGFVGNEDGPVYAAVDSQGCDFGVDSSDNTQSFDIWFEGLQYTAEDNADFSCAETSCSGDVEIVKEVKK